MNGNTVGNVNELIVSRDEKTKVECESNGYEIGAGEPRINLRDLTVGKWAVVNSRINKPYVIQFKRPGKVTCSASLSNSNMEKTFTIIPKSEFDLI